MMTQISDVEARDRQEARIGRRVGDRSGHREAAGHPIAGTQHIGAQAGTSRGAGPAAARSIRSFVTVCASLVTHPQLLSLMPALLHGPARRQALA